MADGSGGDPDRPSGLCDPPRIPADIDRFSANVLFGQPGLYPEGSSMEPAEGHRHSDASIELAMVELAGTAGEAVLDAWVDGATAVDRIVYGEPASPGRIVGPSAGEPVTTRVVNRRYQAEDARLLLPSIVHDLLWSGPAAGHAEETVLHALGAYVHTQLLARAPELASTGTELARRQNSITITLLNSRRPGSATVTLVASDGPGTIPGGDPKMQSSDFWSVPFGARIGDGVPIPALARRVFGVLAGVMAEEVPAVYGDPLGDWCSQHWTSLLASADQLAANRALGLLA
ncbi:MAG: hypothetical protein ABJC79_05735 [Acidimicrobiia bacterium]